MEKKNNAADTSNMSNSKKKRLEREQKNKQAKKAAAIEKTTGIAVALVVVAIIVAIVASVVIKAANKVTPNGNYSACLDDNGYIKGVTASSKVTLPEYKGIEIPKNEIEYTEDELQTAIKTQLDSHEELSTETTAKIADGDKINLDYVGTIDGVEFEGGNSNGNGSDLTIGSGTFIDDFEQQLIGYGVGDNVVVNVTFPEDYATADLAGKDAQFDCTINGIYEAPEFDDAFVAEYLSDYADTAEGYKQYLKDTHYEDNLKNWITDYLKDNTTVSSYPKSYLKQLKALSKYTSMESFEYINQMYTSMYGSGYDSFYDYEGTTEEEYDKELIETSQETEKEFLIYQAIAEKEGLKLTADDYKASLVEKDGNENSYDSQVETYGLPYLVQALYKDKVVEIVKENATFVD